MRLSVVAIAAVVAVVAATAAPAGAPSPRCESIIVPAGSFTWRPTRVVLGVVNLPQPRIAQGVATGERKWRFWTKSGLVVRADAPPVLVAVPAAWRTRVAISWGNVGPTHSILFPSCPPSAGLGDWNPYAGGFYLRSRSACVPLIVRVADRTATRRFGIGTRCR